MGRFETAALVVAGVAVPAAAAAMLALLKPDPELPWDEILELARSRGCDDAKFPLKGLVVIVTGSTSGLGQEIASCLYLLGASVTLLSRSRSKLEATTALFRKQHPNAPGELDFDVADLQDLQAVAAAGGRLRRRLPRIDLLVNNAGIHYGGLVWDWESKLVSPQDYDRTFSANYLGHFLLTAALEPNLRASSNGRVVQIASSYHWHATGYHLRPDSTGTVHAARGDLSGIRVFRQRNLAYGTSKLAQILHARALQRAWGDPATGAPLVVSICPSWVRTEILPKGLIGKIFHGFGFPVRFGICSFLKAALTPKAKMTGDYVANCGAVDWYPRWLSCSRLVSATALRDLLGHLLLAYLLVTQRLFSGARFEESSPESYDVELQEALYKWSSRAVEPYLRSLQS